MPDEDNKKVLDKETVDTTGGEIVDNKVAKNNPYQDRKAALEANDKNPETYNGLMQEDLQKFSRGYDDGPGDPNRPIADTSENAYNLSKSLIDQGKKVPHLRCRNAHQMGADLINSTKNGQAFIIDSVAIAPGGYSDHGYLGYTPNKYSPKHEGYASSWGSSNISFSAANPLELVQKSKALMPNQISFGTDVIYSRGNRGRDYVFKQLAVGDMLPTESNFDKNSPNVINSKSELLENAGKHEKTLTLKPQVSAWGSKGNDSNYGKYTAETAHGELYGNVNFGKGFNWQLRARGNISNIDTKQPSKGANYKLIGGQVETMFTPPSLKLNQNIAVTPFIYADSNSYQIYTKGSIIENGQKYFGEVSIYDHDRSASIVGGVNYTAGTDKLNVHATAFGGKRTVLKGLEENGALGYTYSPETIYGGGIGVSGEINTGGGVKTRLSGEAAQTNVDGKYDLRNRSLMVSEEVSFKGNKIFASKGINNRTIDFKEYVGRYNENRPVFRAGYERQIGDVALRATGEKYGSGYSVGLTVTGVLPF